MPTNAEKIVASRNYVRQLVHSIEHDVLPTLKNIEKALDEVLEAVA